MGFEKLELKREYRSFNNNIVNEFYTPVLKEAVLYKRAVGYFSSTSLVEISKGIDTLISNGGRIQLIASPNLSEEDIEAINLGYKLREDVIIKQLLSELDEPKNYFEAERLNALAYLIAEGKLDIKIAIIKTNNKIGIYHEKVGLIYDENDEKVAFTGSLNETRNALVANYESIDVFTSWKEHDRVHDKEMSFNKIWDNNEKGLEVVDFPKVKQFIVDKYRNYDISLKFEEREEYMLKTDEENKEDRVCEHPYIPSNIKMYDYQIEAIKNWKNNKYIGIFDMATGTGKTFTGIGALVNLYKELEGHLAVVIVCPYTHLVEQWVEELKIFNIKPIVAYSESEDKEYKKKIRNAVMDYNLEVSKFICIITTNATFRTDSIQAPIEKLRGNALIIVDEAHNFGAFNLGGKLPQNFKFRLALSATLDRHNDEEGTGILYSYFEKKCIEYTLERAIAEGKLTPYYYYPVPVYLSDDELEKYKIISRDIGKNIIKMKNGKTKLNTKGKILALKRARLVAGAINKGEELVEIITKYKDNSHMLVYCGATVIDQEEVDVESIRQIDYITKLLGDTLHMKVAQFTSRENNYDRKIIKEKFEDGVDLQALIAIKCLDEGVNIPKIQTAFILASTTNPKEYIQRRGRVLRLSPGKEFAEIYDFVTLPRELDTVRGYSEDEIKIDKSLVINEVNRVLEFRSLSLNAYESDELLDEIQQAYGIDIYKEDMGEGERENGSR